MKMELSLDYFNQQKTKIFSKLAGLSLFCCLVFVLFSCSNIGSLSKLARNYVADGMLVMVYMAGANSLNDEVVWDINSMERGLLGASGYSSEKIKIVVLADKQKSCGSESWTGTRLYEIQKNDSSQSSGKIYSKIINSASNSLGTWRTGPNDEEDMGNIDTLENFILWATETYPMYKKNSLILWNHGGGVYSDFKPNYSICTDEESGRTSESLDNTLYIGEIKKLLESLYPVENPLEFLGFDACFMGMYEVAYQFRNCAKYMSASPATEWGGWNYEYIFSQDNSCESGMYFAINAVDGYKKAYSSVYPNTMTALDLQFTTELKEKIDYLAYCLGQEFKQDPTACKENFEKLHNVATVLHENDKYFQTNLLRYPYYELGSLLQCFANKNISLKYDNDVNFSISTASASFQIQDVLSKMILKTWLGGNYGDAYRESKNLKETALVFEKNIPYGISIFFSNKDNFSHQGFYTSEESGTEGVLGYGCIDAANTTDNDVIDTWYELQCALYE